MSIHIEDLTVRFKNGVTAIDHADLDIPNGIFVGRKWSRKDNFNESINYCIETS